METDNRSRSERRDGARITRRDALMSSAALAVGLPTGAAGVLSGLAGTGTVSAAPSRPNILYIVADDMGWGDVGFHGSDIATPNLDKLAKDGARLEQFYAQPMCTPTRAALMTGRYPLRYGLQTGVIPGAGSYALALDEYILPQMLKDAGYKTAMVGKWHLGHAKAEYWPRQRGFDYFYGALVGEIDHFKHASHGVPDWYRNNKPLVEHGFDITACSVTRRPALSSVTTVQIHYSSISPSLLRTRRSRRRRTISNASSASRTRTAAPMPR
jgi:hypothetical protein